MNFRRQITLSLLLYLVLSSVAFAQVVNIPDPNLRTAVRDALILPADASITQADMNRLTDLDVQDQGIANLTGLEFASNLISLVISNSPITDLRPIAGLAQLERLYMWSIPRLDITPLANLTSLRTLAIASCDIIDISPLIVLAQLTDLNLRYNRIIDITPLANLTHLETLRLNGNRITDVTALAGLTNLEFLEIQHNQITDHSPLDALVLSHFIYDQTCELSPLSIHGRIKDRGFPSIITAWAGPDWVSIPNRPDLSGVENVASHDLWFSVPQFGLRFKETPDGFGMAGSLDEAIQRRDEFLAVNPNMIFLVDIRMREDWASSFPEDWPYWIRDTNGNVVSLWPGANLLDFTHPYIQDRIVHQAIAVSKCGLYDGIFFDWWNEHDAVLAFRGNEAEQRARDSILQRIRAETRPDFLILGNTNYSIIPRTGPFINGGFMETGVPGLLMAEELEIALAEIESSLLWLDQNLREPRINALHGGGDFPEFSPANRRQMRAITTLTLTHSDGYVLYAITGGLSHYWYDFWDADLGQPVGAKGQLYQGTDGLYIREYTNGWAVYNHSGAPQIITLPEEVQGVASGMVNTKHALPNLDGEMYLRVKPPKPADVNGDGVVNILDLTIIARDLGTDRLEGDVNGDGVVNVIDLVFVANQF